VNREEAGGHQGESQDLQADVLPFGHAIGLHAASDAEMEVALVNDGPFTILLER
jgi:D-Tyr-tRNAtyr deacylase